MTTPANRNSQPLTIPQKTLLLLLVAIIVATGCATPRQLVLDAEVDRLCAIDGGPRVFEYVRLPPNDYERYTKHLKSLAAAGPDDAYYYVRSSEQSGGFPDDGVLNKTSSRIIRRADGKVLNSNVIYSRVGGDVPLGFHPSSYSCPKTFTQGPSPFLKKGDQE